VVAVDVCFQCGESHAAVGGGGVERLLGDDDSPYGKARFPVSGEVRIFDDSARADDGDRECSFRESWSGCNTGNGVYSFTSEIKFRK